MDTYGVYINPFPGLMMSNSRLKSEARGADLAWWVKADSKDEALKIFIEESSNPDYIEELFKSGQILVEKKS